MDSGVGAVGERGSSRFYGSDSGVSFILSCSYVPCDMLSGAYESKSTHVYLIVA